jgi:hypothetical protein
MYVRYDIHTSYSGEKLAGYTRGIPDGDRMESVPGKLAIGTGALFDSSGGRRDDVMCACM